MEEYQPVKRDMWRYGAFNCAPLLPPISLLGEGNVICQEEGRSEGSKPSKDKVRTYFDIDTVLLKRVWPAKVDLILPW